MRITCPNCGAQYEVDAALIPESGRDVQCSNCGKGWFQTRETGPAETAGDEPDRDAPAEVEETEAEAEADEEVVEEREAVVTARAGEETTVAATFAEEATVAADRDDAAGAPPPREEPAAAPAAEDEDADDDGPGPAVPPPQVKRDESVLAVLREEAERELAQRRAEAATIETQPELGLTDGGERRAAAAAAATAVQAGRRELLPDIDVINSTLRSDIERGGTSDAEEFVVEERRRGFRLGFGIVMLIVAALIGLYLSAAWLAETVPALEPFLVAYVGWANGLRAWLDGLLAAGVEGLSALTPPPTET